MPRVQISPWFALPVLGGPAAGWMLWSLAVELGLATVEPLVYIAWFSGAYLATMVLHELGHVLAGALLGIRWIHVRLAGAVGVGLDSRTNGDQVVISLAGPAAHFCAVAVLLLVSKTMPWEIGNPIGAAGWLLLGEALINLLPIGPLDGGRMVRAAWACLRGSSQEFFDHEMSTDPHSDTDEEPLIYP